MAAPYRVTETPMDPGPTLRAVTRVLDALGCGALLFDRAGNIVFVNARLCRMARRRRDELTGRNLLDLYPPDEQAFLRQSLESFDEDRDGEFFVPLPDGSRLPVLWTARPLPDGTARVELRVVTLVDLSPQKRTEAALREEARILAGLSDNAIGSALDLSHYSNLLEQRVRERTTELRDAQIDSIYMLAVACEAKDRDTGQHVLRIQHYSTALARRLGFGEEEAEQIGYSAILHDVGKLHVPDRILKKPGPLDPAERQQIQMHTVIGERILSPRPFFARARRIARAHHENWNGSGYPDGVSGHMIPIEARIVHLADVYDALTTPRVYKVAWPGYQASAVIAESSARMFDPEVVAAFTSLDQEGFFSRPHNLLAGEMFAPVENAS